MDDKEFLKKLNHLKGIKPDNQWKNEYREILLSQISGGQTEGKDSIFSWRVFFGDLIPRSLKLELIKPIWISVLAVFIAASGSVVSVHASRDTKPGDSLYIAKMISERTQFAMTFGEKEKAKLNLEFASNRAEEISQLLKESTAIESDNNQKVEQLSQNFKKELSQAKDRLSKIDISTANKANEDDQFFGANTGKDSQGMEISQTAESQPADDKAAVNDRPAITATTTPEQPTEPAAKSADEIIAEAEKLFDEKNYDGTINKLQEVNNVIDQTQSDNQGEVKGVSETASSTD